MSNRDSFRPLRRCVPFLAAGLALALAGCSSRFEVLVKVQPDVDAPKAIDIVWILTDNEARHEEILSYQKKGMAEYFRTGKTSLTPGFFRFYRFARDERLGGETTLEVRSEPGATRAKLYGPYRDAVPSGTRMGFLFIEYGKGSEELKLPLMIYPKLPTYAGYEEKAPKGLSIEVSRDKCRVIPLEKEDPAVIQEAERLKEAQAESGGAAPAPGGKS